jgi:hypothetical protein
MAHWPAGITQTEGRGAYSDLDYEGMNANLSAVCCDWDVCCAWSEWNSWGRETSRSDIAASEFADASAVFSIQFVQQTENEKVPKEAEHFLYLTDKKMAAITRQMAMNCRTTRQRIKFWLPLSLRPPTKFHRPSRSTVATAASAKGMA